MGKQMEINMKKSLIGMKDSNMKTWVDGECLIGKRRFGCEPCEEIQPPKKIYVISEEEKAQALEEMRKLVSEKFVKSIKYYKERKSKFDGLIIEKDEEYVYDPEDEYCTGDDKAG